MGNRSPRLPTLASAPGIAFNLAVQYHLVNRTVEY
jgi:hypothetical protein